MSRVNLADIFWCDEEDIPGIEQAIRNANHGTGKNLYDDLRKLGKEGFQSMVFSPKCGYMVAPGVEHPALPDIVRKLNNGGRRHVTKYLQTLHRLLVVNEFCPKYIEHVSYLIRSIQCLTTTQGVEVSYNGKVHGAPRGGLGDLVTIHHVESLVCPMDVLWLVKLTVMVRKGHPILTMSNHHTPHPNMEGVFNYSNRINHRGVKVTLVDNNWSLAILKENHDV